MEKSINQTAENHRWYFEKSFSSSKKYEQFINWFRVEFYSFLQHDHDHDSFLTIYFPNGEVNVKSEKLAGAMLISKISIESKCRKVGLKMKKSLSEFLDHIESYDKFGHKPVLNE